jgi:hypothetical protein
MQMTSAITETVVNNGILTTGLYVLEISWFRLPLSNLEFPNTSGTKKYISYPRGAQNPTAKTRCLLNFIRFYLIPLCPWYGTCFLSLLLGLSLWWWFHKFEKKKFCIPCVPAWYKTAWAVCPRLWFIVDCIGCWLKFEWIYIEHLYKIT